MNPARLRLYLDEDVPVQIAPPLRRAGFDVLTTLDAGRLHASDESQLEYAASVHRVLITRNRDDFTDLTDQFAEAGRPHAGVLIVAKSFAQTDIGGMARAVVRYFEGHPLGVQAYLADFISRQG